MRLKKYLYKKVGSTNNVALRLIEQGNQRGIILTDQQTKGKGQRKNIWISTKGNLFYRYSLKLVKKYLYQKL
jgi:biotin-(acetyl-CoA carboxylase) ligase